MGNSRWVFSGARGPNWHWSGFGAFPKVRDGGAGKTGPLIRFTSGILPLHLRRAKSVEALLPWLYLKGISGVVFSEAPGLSASTNARLGEV